MKIGTNGLNLIKEFEGYRDTAYQDSVGIWTIGYGTTRVDGKSIQPGMKCTEKQALTWLMDDITDSENIVLQNVTVPLTQNQFDALVSIVYNVGPGVKNKKDGIIRLKDGRPSTLLRKLNMSDYVGAAMEFPKWCRAGGKILLGLERRRLAEKNLFLTNK